MSGISIVDATALGAAKGTDMIPVARVGNLTATTITVADLNNVQYGDATAAQVDIALVDTPMQTVIKTDATANLVRIVLPVGGTFADGLPYQYLYVQGEKMEFTNNGLVFYC